LANFTGVLQADAYAGFDQLYGEKIKEAACWAHVRRKFYDIHVALASPDRPRSARADRATVQGRRGDPRSFSRMSATPCAKHVQVPS